MKYSLPVYVMEMPLNADGGGPEMDEDKVVKVTFEVWDMEQQTVCICFNRQDAVDIVSWMNNAKS